MSYAFNPKTQTSANNDGKFGSSHSGLSQFFSGSQSEFINNMDGEMNSEYFESNKYEYHPAPTKLRVHPGPNFMSKTKNGANNSSKGPIGKPRRTHPYTQMDKEILKNSSSNRIKNSSSDGFEINEERGKQLPQPENIILKSRNSEQAGPNYQYKKRSPEANPNFTLSTPTSQNKFTDVTFRHFTGSVDHVVRWQRMLKSQDLKITYEASGTLENMISQESKQLLFIRGESGHILQVVFYTIDRKLPYFKQGAIVMATGRMVGSNKLQAFDAVEITKEEQQSAERLWFLCQRSLEALI